MKEGSNELLNKIEKLIVDGQKEVLGRLDNISADVGVLKQDVGWLKVELKRIDKKHDVTAQAQYDLLQDVKKDVREVKEKLDEHVKLPAHV